MIESQIPDLRAVQLHELLGSDDITLHRGLQWIGADSDKVAAVAASTGGGAGAERIG
ncbi:hypothetical protein [Streptomyces sp. NPDC087787]|uniref:hypothetical protein n=1 Tax=Streptomyces sp. NPDC087787 TaxID=3365803 RepID=UPI0038093E54